jgi:ceramide glucosyltransferase
MDAVDPALLVVARLLQEFPNLDIDVVVNSELHGHNYKSSNLINMLTKARHPIVLISDSDVRVGPGYLAAVTAPLVDPGVGLVTCLSHDLPTPPVWSRIGAMYVNEWYFPSVILAWLFGHQGYASGQTLCFRRTTLDAIGGLGRIADHLADDYQLGQLIVAQGLRIVLSAYEIQAEHHEPTLIGMARHELRWMRTLHTVRPVSFRMIFLTFSLVLAATGLLLTGANGHPLAWALFSATALARLGIHFARRLGGGRPLFEDVLLIPLRDLLTCWLWCQSFFSRRVRWRGQEFAVERTGLMRRVS